MLGLGGLACRRCGGRVLRGGGGGGGRVEVKLPLAGDRRRFGDWGYSCFVGDEAAACFEGGRGGERWEALSSGDVGWSSEQARAKGEMRGVRCGLEEARWRRR